MALGGWYSSVRRPPPLQFDRDNIYILDGGFASTATEFVQDAVKEIDKNPLWSCGLTHTEPETVQKVHEEHLKAGARIITTNTYQCSVDLYKENLNLPNPILDSAKLFGKSVECADKAINSVFKDCPRLALVAGSVGPYGACLGDGSEYTGNYLDKISKEDLSNWHFERIKRLTAAGVDFLAVETIPSVDEALAILDVVLKFPDLKCWISFQCKDDSSTARGEKFDSVINSIFQHKAYPTRILAVGVNCTNPENVSPLLKLANIINKRSAWPEVIDFKPLPYVVYPNSGENWDELNKAFTGNAKDDFFLSEIPNWLDLGANVIGGCCRVGPPMIRKIKDVVLNHLSQNLSTAKRDHSPDLEWSGIERQLRAKTEKKEKTSEKKGQKTKKKVTSPFDFGQIYAVPGLVPKDVAQKQLQAICEHLEIDYSVMSNEGESDENELKQETLPGMNLS